MARTLEDYVDDAIAKLRADLPGAVNAMNVARADFVMEAPADDGGAINDSNAVVSYSTGVMTVIRYPWVEVAAASYDLANLSIGQYDADLGIEIIVRAQYRDASSRDNLDRALKRYNRMLLDLLLTPGAFGTGESVQRIRGRFLTNPETNEAAEVTGQVLIVFSIDSALVRP